MDFFSLFRRRDAAAKAGRFGFAVVGLGHIAGYFLDALRDSPACAVTALVSGDAAKAEKLAKRYGVAHWGVYAGFEAVCAQPGVDAVYLALPVSLHREFTERAAAAGKHVLCEKPMAPNTDDARAMLSACAAAGVRLSIAYRCPHAAMHQRLRSLVQSGALGAKETLRIESGFGFALEPGWRNEPGLAGGGSLFDVGIYPLNASRFLLGEDPVDVAQAHAVTGAYGLERSITWSSRFASGAEAVCASSYEEKIADTLQVSGERGCLRMAPAFSHRERYRLRGEYAGAGGLVRVDEAAVANEPSEFRLEAEQLAAAVRGEAELLTPGEDGLADMVAMEAIYRAAKVPFGRANPVQITLLMKH